MNSRWYEKRLSAALIGGGCLFYLTRHTKLLQFGYTLFILKVEFMTVTIAKWGNSVGVRIPSLVLKTAGFSIGDRVQTQVQPDRSIIIRAVAPARKKVNIMDMIDTITPETLPNFAEFNDQPVGREVW